MLTCDMLRFTVMALFTVLFATGHLTLWMIYAGVVVLAIGGSMFLGGQTASIPFLLGKDRTKGAVAALQATEQGVNLVAPPIGGALFGLLGPLPALAINALTYLTSQVAIASVRTFGPDEPGRLPSLRQIGGDVATGWRFVFADRTMMLLSFTSCAYKFVGSIGYVALIPYFKRAFLARRSGHRPRVRVFLRGRRDRVVRRGAHALGVRSGGDHRGPRGRLRLAAAAVDAFDLDGDRRRRVLELHLGLRDNDDRLVAPARNPRRVRGPRVRRRAAHRARRHPTGLDSRRLVRRPPGRAHHHDDLGARLHGVHVRARVLAHGARRAPLSSCDFSHPDSARENRRAGS